MAVVGNFGTVLPSGGAAAALLPKIKIFIYHNLILSPNVQAFNHQAAQVHKLSPHLQYLVDFYEMFKRFETQDPNEADYFFVPLFLAGWQFTNRDPVDLINQACIHLPRKNHILVSTGDVGQRAESPYEMTHEANPARAYDKKYEWLDDRFNLIVLESTPSLHPQDIAMLPYQPRSIPKRNLDRDILVSFMGRLVDEFLPPNHIRGGRLVEFRKRNTDGLILIGNVSEFKTASGAQFDVHELMARSIFTLCPAGYGRWTFRMVEALLNGSIPLVISDDYVLPFSDIIDWSDYGYVIPEKDLDELPSFVKSVPIGEIHQKQRNIQRDRHLFERDFVLGHVLNLLRYRQNFADPAISRMRSPEQMQIICVDVTNKCDLACSNCTRLLENQDKKWEMTPENFRLALQSLRNYPGMIAMIGGNPCVHSKFEELCQIFREETPNIRQRGLWTNNFFKHRKIVEETFGGFNLNPHNNPRATGPLKSLYDTKVVQQGFNGGYYDKPSHHAPILTAVKDLYDEKTMWRKISRCDINREWSASIVQNQGKLRAYFCEVAAAFDLARNEDHGFEVTLDWWKHPVSHFSNQVKHFCPGCGVPARLKGHFDHEDTDTYTESNADLALKSAEKKKRKINLLQPETVVQLGRRVTNYAKY